MKVYLVIAEDGEYDSYAEWVCAAFVEPGQAVFLAKQHQERSDADRIAYDLWCKEYSPHYWNGRKQLTGALTDEREAEIFKIIGTRPNGPEANSFWVEVIEIGVWGRSEKYLVAVTSSDTGD